MDQPASTYHEKGIVRGCADSSVEEKERGVAVRSRRLCAIISNITHRENPPLGLAAPRLNEVCLTDSFYMYLKILQ